MLIKLFYDSVSRMFRQCHAAEHQEVSGDDYWNIKNIALFRKQLSWRRTAGKRLEVYLAPYLKPQTHIARIFAKTNFYSRAKSPVF